jgi:hypothetical protein
VIQKMLLKTLPERRGRHLGMRGLPNIKRHRRADSNLGPLISKSK